MNIDYYVLKNFNIYHQYLRKKHEFLILEGYRKIRSDKNELEK